MQDIRELVLLLQQRNVHPFKGVAENSKLVQFSGSKIRLV